MFMSVVPSMVAGSMQRVRDSSYLPFRGGGESTSTQAIEVRCRLLLKELLEIVMHSEGFSSPVRFPPSLNGDIFPSTNLL